MHRLVNCVIGFGAVIALVLGSALKFASGPVSMAPFAVEGQTLDPDVNPSAPVVMDRAGPLSVMTWNLGSGSDGRFDASTGSQSKPAEQARRLETIATYLKNNGADMLLVQNIDFYAERNNLVDQYDYLMREAAYPYGARVVALSKRYIPVPLWRVWEWLGPVATGGAILSRLPICGSRVYLHPRPKDEPWLQRNFSVHSYTHRVRICAGNETFFVINSHLNVSFSSQREREAISIERIVAEARADAPVAVVGGDFNAVPPEDHDATNRAQDNHDRYRGDETITIVRAVPRLVDVFTKLARPMTPGLLRTYPVESPQVRIDYLFVDQAIHVTNAEVVRMTGSLSSHFPVRATLNW